VAAPHGRHALAAARQQLRSLQGRAHLLHLHGRAERGGAELRRLDAAVASKVIAVRSCTAYGPDERLLSHGLLLDTHEHVV
jgi:hypothetical protein